MAKARSIQLVEYSLSMALAAIEIYNKPQFPYREAVFSVLMCSAWEGLSKARILQQNRNNPRSIQIKVNNRYLKTFHGDFKTIDGMEAVQRVIPSKVVVENISHLTRLRNQSVHHMPRTEGLVQLVHSLATSSLDNYAYYLEDWFGVKVAKYNFFILPLGFGYPFTKLSAINLSKEPDEVKEIVASVVDAQKRGEHQDGDRSLVLEIHVDLVSEKQMMKDPDYYAAVTGQEEGTATQFIQRDFLNKYPFKHDELVERVQRSHPSYTRNDQIRLIAQYGIKEDEKYAGLFFGSDSERRKGRTKNTPFRYSSDCIAYLKQLFGQEMDVP